MAPTPSCPVVPDTVVSNSAVSGSVMRLPSEDGEGPPPPPSFQTAFPPAVTFKSESEGSNVNDPSCSISALEKTMLKHFIRFNKRQDDLFKKMLQFEHHIMTMTARSNQNSRQMTPDQNGDASLAWRPSQASQPFRQLTPDEYGPTVGAKLTDASFDPDAPVKKVRAKKFKSPASWFTSNQSTASQAESDDSRGDSNDSRDDDGVPRRRRRSTTTSRDDMIRLAAIVARHENRFQMSPWAKSVWLFFENRNSGHLAHFYGTYLAPFMILIGVFLSFFQNSDGFDIPVSVLSSVQMCIEILFAAELLLRFKACPDRCAFLFGFFNFVDFLSVVPIPLRIYLLVNGKSASSFAMLGVVPIVRLLKILRRFRKFQLLMEAFWLTAEALPVLLFSFGLIAMFFSGLIYYVEPRSLIPTLPEALWFVIVTMTTVGYGDIVPDTTLGRSLAMILMVVSALYMAMPIGIVGNAFSKAWDDRDRLLLRETLRETFSVSGVSIGLFRDMVKLFAGSDISDAGKTTSDGDSIQEEEPSLTLEQFKNMIIALQINVSDDRVADLFNSVDVDGGGSIDMEEFVELLFPASPLQKQKQAISRAMNGAMSIQASHRMFSMDLSTVDTFGSSDEGADDAEHEDMENAGAMPDAEAGVATTEL